MKIVDHHDGGLSQQDTKIITFFLFILTIKHSISQYSTTIYLLTHVYHQIHSSSPLSAPPAAVATFFGRPLFLGATVTSSPPFPGAAAVS